MPRLAAALACAVAAVAHASGAAAYVSKTRERENKQFEELVRADRADTDRDAQEMTVRVRLVGCNLDFPEETELRKPHFECISFGGDDGKHALGADGPNKYPLEYPNFTEEQYNLEHFYGSRKPVSGMALQAWWDDMTQAETEESSARQRVGQSVFPGFTTGLQKAKTPAEVDSRPPVMAACQLMTDPMMSAPKRVAGATMVVDVSNPLRAHLSKAKKKASTPQKEGGKPNVAEFLRTREWGDVACPQDSDKACGRCLLDLTYKGPREAPEMLQDNK